MEHASRTRVSVAVLAKDVSEGPGGSLTIRETITGD